MRTNTQTQVGSEELSRAQIRVLLEQKRFYGAKADIARRARVSKSAVTKWLNGTSPSANIAEVAQAKMRELLKEHANAA